MINQSCHCINEEQVNEIPKLPESSAKSGTHINKKSSSTFNNNDILDIVY